jgi:hypothetical protein
MGYESFSGSAEPVVAASEQPTSIERGAAWLLSQGVSVEAATVQLVGPLPECNGSLAEMMGVEGHSQMKAGVEHTLAEAKKRGDDPSDALMSGLFVMLKRDDQGEVQRIDPRELARLKKN